MIMASVPKNLWWHRYLTGAGAQVENLCHQSLMWGAGIQDMARFIPDNS
jgi:hypothetical protein